MNSRKIPLFFLLAAAAWLGVALLAGALTQFWEISEFQGFAGGKFENVSLDSEGRLALAPKLERIFQTEQAVIWSAAAASDGTVYLGTGHEGKLFRLPREGEPSLLWTAPEMEIFALGAAAPGEVFAGTSPKGKVYRINSEGEAEEFFDPGETYIWSLAFAPSGTLFIGTGDGGKIFAVDSEGKGELYFDTEQRHVISLALDGEGRLLAGTDPNGVLYRVEDKGRAFTLYDSELPELRAVRVAANGDIYAAAMGGGVTQATQAIPGSAVISGGTATISVTASAGSDSDVPSPEAPGGSASRQAQQASSPIVLSTPMISYGVEQAAVLRIRPGHAVEKLWTSNESNILAMAPAADHGHVFAATDKDGRVYRIDLNRRRSLLAQTDQEQITQLLRMPRGLLLTTAHSGNVYLLHAGAAREGSYETGVHDSGGVSQWGMLEWTADVPAGAAVEFVTRSGNSAQPDSTWSEWSAPIRGEGERRVPSPPARFLQWKARLTSGEAGGPALEKVRVSFLPQNSPPVIDRIAVSAAAGAENAASDSSSSNGSSSNDSGAYSITVTAAGGSPTPAAGSTQQRNVGGQARRLKIEWQASDPDGDPLRAKLSFRGEGESVWKLLKADLDKAEYAIDSDALADGLYRFRVEVSDAASNAAGRALSAEKISEPVLVDHTPPEVRLIRAEGRERVEFEASDAASAIVHAEYSIDAGRWIPVLSDDGISDSRSERFTIELGELAEGEHLLTLRVRDQAGNRGLAKAILR